MEDIGSSAWGSPVGCAGLQALQDLHGRDQKMRRRSSRSKSIGLTGAVLVELGTILAIIAFAQPSWTRSLIEQVNSPPATPSPVVSAASLVNSPQTSPLQSSSQQAFAQPVWQQQQQQAQLGLNNSGWGNVAQPAWQPSPAANWSDNTDRIAQAAWPPTRLPAQEHWSAPQYPVYPPSVSTSAPPAWSAGY